MSNSKPTPYKNYQWIVADPELLGGKLAVRGTRLSLALIRVRATSVKELLTRDLDLETWLHTLKVGWEPRFVRAPPVPGVPGASRR